MKNINEISLIILGLMQNTDGFLTAKQISEVLGVSTRSVKRYINIISASDEYGSFHIVAAPNKGFKLEVLDLDKFEFYKKNISKIDFAVTTYKELLKLVFFSGVSQLSTICERMNYSESSLMRMIDSANKEFEEQEIKIIRDENNIYIDGNEIRVRNLMVKYFLLYHDELIRNMEPYKQKYFESISEFIHKNSFYCESSGIVELLFISLLRVEKNYEIEFNPILKYIYLENCLKDNKTLQIHDFFVKEFNVNLSEDEQIYIWITSLHEQNESWDFSGFLNIIDPFIDDSLKIIDRKFGTDFHKDESLHKGLTYHISASLINYLVFKKTENKYIDEIRLNYTNAYCYARELVSLLYERFAISIDENDIGYLTIHFATSIEKEVNDATYEIYIVVNKDTTSANLLKTRLENRFNGLKVREIIEKDKILAHQGRFLVTCEDGIDDEHVIRVSPFVTYDDATKINKELLDRSGYAPLQDISFNDNFYVLDQFDEKKEILKFLLNEMETRNYLNKEESQQVINREMLSSTEIAMHVAFPHVVIKRKSFLTVAILKQPILWKDNVVKIVFLMGMKENDERSLEAVKFLFKKITNVEKINRLCRTSNFKDFLEELRK